MRHTLILTVFFAFTGIMLLAAGLTNHSTFVISGTVLHDSTAVSEARVRIQGSSDYTLSDSSGKFVLATTRDSATFVGVTAGKEGFYNAIQLSLVGDTAVTIQMSALPAGDDSSYTFSSPIYCSSCHGSLFLEWKKSKHAGSATNKMLRQMYDGTDTSGTGAIFPGFKMDFPDEGGDCADCHAPSAALKLPGNTDLLQVLQAAKVDTNGVFCDFCHKVATVEVNYSTGVNGAISVKRPPISSPRDINFGQFDDVTTGWMGGSYNPVYAKSDFCSGCHQYNNRHGLLVDDTYDSWAVSSYAANGIQCQDCHMKPWSDSIFVNGIGSIDAIARDPERIYNHKFVGSTEDFLDSAARLLAAATIQNDSLLVSTAVVNAEAGHKLPTGVSFRHMLLTVEAFQNGQPIFQLSGDTIPSLGGVGDRVSGNLSGLAGKTFALIIEDAQNNISPAPNWLATSIAADTRIPADSTDYSDFVFRHNGTGDVELHIQLLYRAVYKPWADNKGWDMREFLMADTVITLPLVGVEDGPEIAAQTFELRQNYPNPFNGSTSIEYYLPRASTVRLEVFNVAGQQITGFFSAKMLNAGKHLYVWDGKDAAGNSLASGIYFYRISAGDFVATKRMLYIK